MQVFYRGLHGQPEQRSGLPDFFACVGGRLVGLECKRPSRRDALTALQAKCLKEIIVAGGVVAVVTSGQEAKEVIELVQRGQHADIDAHARATAVLLDRVLARTTRARGGNVGGPGPRPEQQESDPVGH